MTGFQIIGNRNRGGSDQMTIADDFLLRLFRIFQITDQVIGDLQVSTLAGLYGGFHQCGVIHKGMNLRNPAAVFGKFL